MCLKSSSKGVFSFSPFFPILWNTFLFSWASSLLSACLCVFNSLKSVHKFNFCYVPMCLMRPFVWVWFTWLRRYNIARQCFLWVERYLQQCSHLVFPKASIAKRADRMVELHSMPLMFNQSPSLYADMPEAAVWLNTHHWDKMAVSVLIISEADMARGQLWQKFYHTCESRKNLMQTNPKIIIMSNFLFVNRDRCQ